MFSCDNYFHNQKKKKRLQHRRLRILNDSYSLFGDKATVVFRGRQGSIAGSAVGARPNQQRRPPSGILRPGSSRGRHVAIAPVASALPPVDPSGPKFVSADDQDIEASDIHHTEEKREFLREVDEKQNLQRFKRKKDWNLNEAKFASTSILSGLSKFLYQISDSFEVSLPVDLVDDLVRNHEHLITNTVVVKRTWQTDCYLDFEIKNKQPFLTSEPVDEVRAGVNAFVGEIVKKQRIDREKHVQLKQKPTKTKKMASPERPMTARSVMSNYSIKSDMSQPSDDGRESRYDYDLLPPELRPNILHYRRESATPKLKTVRTSSGFSTRINKVRKMMRAIDGMTPKGRKKKAKFADEENSGEGYQDRASATVQDKPETTTIAFSMAAPNVLDEDWIVTPGDSQDPEANTLLMWEKQLKEFMRNREEEKILAKQRGEDSPLLVKFYNDPQIRTLRTKSHQRSATFPMPAVFSKLPPSVTSFATPTPNEALLIGEGLTVFVLTLPDGSGYCNYHSGRIAVSVSRYAGVGKGVYTLVYEDSEGSPLIAYFTPSGSGCCYHHSGSLRMLFNKEGGSLFDEDVYVIRKWAWPTSQLNLSVPVNIQINANLSLRCSSLTSMLLRFSCRGQSYKFSVAPLPESLERKKPTDLTQGVLLSDAPFCSKSALGRTQPPPLGGKIEDSRPSLMKKGKKKGKNEKVHRATSGTFSEDEQESPHTSENEKHAKELAKYRDKIKSIVDNWMGHYRESIGIALPNRLLSSSRKSPSDKSFSSRDVLSHARGRLVQSSVGYYPGSYSRPSSRQGKHTRSFTHPVPSPSTSRAPSPPLQLGLSIMRVPSTDPGLGSGPRALLSRSVSPPNALRPITPLEYIKDTPLIEQRKPFKTGMSKLRIKPTRMSSGCPIGLHNMIWKGIETMPPCKCEKRHIPYISDLEYDTFLHSHVPKSQLVIVCVVSSVVENSCPCEPMLNAIYCSQNRNRFSPCTQSSGDAYRLLKYDTCQGLKDLRTTKPLLVERHNVTPGMFLMYMGGKLVHADRTFNGYGTTKKDFMKQIQICINDGKAERYLPSDFKFARHNGSKVQNQNAWAYPISGVMQDLIPFTPVSSSGSRSTSRHSVHDVEDSKLEDSFYSGSFAEMSQCELESDFNSRRQSRCDLELSQAASITSVCS